MGNSSRDDSATDGDASSGGGGDAPKPSNSSLYSEGEKILAYHGPRIYEAKASEPLASLSPCPSFPNYAFFLVLCFALVCGILVAEWFGILRLGFEIFSLQSLVQKAEIRKNEWRYFVHYLGIQKSLLWVGHLANSWDEWVGVDRILKYTEENIMKQQALDKKQGVDKNTKSGRSAHTKPKSSADAKAEKEDQKNNVAKGKKRKNDSGTEKESVNLEKLVKIQIPVSLRKQLVEDWEFVCEQDKLVNLPRSPTVDDILQKYLDYRTKKDGKLTDPVGEVLKGIRCYFDKALPLILLYKKERKQYHETVVGDVSPSTIYGAEHLLRLFVKLPELLAYVNIEEETLTRLQQQLIDLLKFLQKNQSTFFLSAYDGSKSVDGKGKGKNE
ncbi:hypothetical protein ACLB2K_003730 [Fragaria x ananassa]